MRNPRIASAAGTCACGHVARSLIRDRPVIGVLPPLIQIVGLTKSSGQISMAGAEFGDLATPNVQPGASKPANRLNYQPYEIRDRWGLLASGFE
jgi:hypothetical protein